MRKYSFKINGNNYDVDIKNVESGLAEVEVNGTIYNVEIDKSIAPTKTPTLVRTPVKTKPAEASIPKAATSGGGAPLNSPLPGTIMKILVAPGESFKKGDKLIIMEAMKMENNVLAETDGTVGAIKVSVGDNVLEGDTLLTIA